MPITKRRFRKLLFAVVALCTFVQADLSPAYADWDSFWHSVCIGYHRNAAWPEPFIEADAAVLRAPFRAMSTNGWRANNTIGHELFETDIGQLTRAGQRRVHWIATQAPRNHRIVYVLRGHSDTETNSRVASVHELIDTMNHTSTPPQVQVTDIYPNTSSGVWAEKVNRMRIESMPAPQLPGSASSSGSP